MEETDNTLLKWIDKVGYALINGPINKKTLSCNEDGVRRVINNDKYGFKNRNSVTGKYLKKYLNEGSN